MQVCLDLASAQEYAGSIFKHVVLLADIYTTFVASSCDCERAFSKQNIIKTKLRLSTAHLDQLLRVSIEGPAIESFDFEVVYHHWKKSGNRHKYVRQLPVPTISDETSSNSESDASDEDCLDDDYDSVVDMDSDSDLMEPPVIEIYDSD